MPSPAPARRRDRWVGLSPDERRVERRALLTRAAFELLGTEGSAGTTVRAVCERAALNPRYFYESFDDLDELVVATYDLVVAELGEQVRTATEEAGDDPAARTRAAVAATVDFVDADRRRGRVLYVEALGNEALNRHRLETGHALVDVLQADATRRGAPPGSEEVARLAAALLVGGFSELLVAWLDGRIDLRRDELVDHTTELLLALIAAAAGIASRTSRS